MKANTRCMDCDSEFPQGELVLCNDDSGNSIWGCPDCHSYNVEDISKNKIKFPCNPDEINVKYEEGEGH